MADQDLPELDESVVQLPVDIREDLAERARGDLYFMARGVLGFHDMTIGCHGPLCVFHDVNSARFKGILMPRDHYKSSVITVAGSLQRQMRDLEQRQLIRNESASNAQGFLSAIRQHAEGNRVFRALFSSAIPKDLRRVVWNNEALEFNREGHYPEKSITAAGITTATTSQHYTHITDDDPISEEAVASEKVMATTINRLKGVLPLLVKPEINTYTLVGTRWLLHDTYSWARKNYGAQMSWFARGAIEDGLPIFPELMSLETLALKRTIMGEYLFSCLMMNNPRDSDVQDLNVGDLRFFEWSPNKERIGLLDAEGAIVESWRLEQLDITVTVDLAPAETDNSDRNAVVTVGVTPTGKLIALEAWATRCTPLVLIEKLFEVQARFRPRFIAIEGVAYQKAFKYFLKQACEERDVYMRIEEAKAPPSSKSHVRGLQPIMATHRMYIDPLATILRQEMAEFPLGEHDDAVDALAMHLQFLRGVLSPDKWLKFAAAETAIIKRIRSGDLSMESVDPDTLDDIEDEKARTEVSRFSRFANA